MLMPIYLAWTSQNPLSREIVDNRLQVILRFLHLNDSDQFNIQITTDGHCGLFFINYKITPFRIPLFYKSVNKLSLSAYLPFGASTFFNEYTLRSGEYLPELLALLCKSPQTLFELAPPQVLCQLDCQEHKLTLCNDWRGFGRLYEYKTSFGTIWSNKMAAALIFAGLPAELDRNALADMAAFSMFSGSGTGYKNLRMASPGTFIESDTLNGQIHVVQLNGDACGLIRTEPDVDAVEITHFALITWMRELELFTKGKNKIYLSGGRDSRVVASALLAQKIDCEVISYSPPAKDVELSQKLLEQINIQANVEILSIRESIIDWYKDKGSIFDISDGILRNFNSDISVKSFFNSNYEPSFDSVQDTSIIGGNQGEVAHNCYYNRDMYNNDILFDGNPDYRPSTRRIDEFIKQISLMSLGTTEFSKQESFNNIYKYHVNIGKMAGFSGFYILDYLYLSLYLNRQWAGATGAYDSKTPLTIYPYCKNGINQNIEKKINSDFIRNVISSFIPKWSGIPFFHELPKSEREDFYTVYPTLWDMNRGNELIEICDGGNIVWELFDHKFIMDIFTSMLDENIYNATPNVKTSQINSVAQVIIWIMNLEKNLSSINNIIQKQIS